MKRLFLILTFIPFVLYAGTSKYIDGTPLKKEDKAAINDNFRRIDTELTRKAGVSSAGVDFPDGTVQPTAASSSLFIGQTIVGGALGAILYSNTSQQLSQASLVGTSNQISIVNSPDGTFTFSTPQDIATNSNVRFNALGINGAPTTGNSAIYSLTTQSGSVQNTSIFSNIVVQSGGNQEQDNLYGLVQNEAGGGGTYTGGFFGFIGDARLRGSASNTAGIYGGIGQALVLDTANVSGPVVGVAAFIEHDAGTTVNNTFGFYQYPGFYNGTRTGHHYGVYLSSTPNANDYSVRAERGIMWMNSGQFSDSDVILSGTATINMFFADASTSFIGIGTNTPTAQLHTTGSVRMAAFGAGAATFDASGNVSSVSDERLKNIQGQFKAGLKGILKINPILYRWNEKSGMETEYTYAGFSAQNVGKNIPEAVFKNRDGIYSLQDRALLASLVNAVKELSAEVDKLKKAKP